MPAVRIGVNPAARGLVGLDSWFWIEGFDGSVDGAADHGVRAHDRGPHVVRHGDVGLRRRHRRAGDLGRAYPEESTVQHVHQHDGTFTITATIDLVPEYRVDGGPWLTLADLQATATTDHDVEERQAVITDA